MAKDTVPDAAIASEDQPPAELPIGAPILIVDDINALDAGGAACPTCERPACTGSTSIVQCDCQQKFRINLFSNKPCECPACGRQYTHLLIICALDNTAALAEAVAQVMTQNGYELAGDDDDDDDDDDQDGELAGDDDGAAGDDDQADDQADDGDPE